MNKLSAGKKDEMILYFHKYDFVGGVIGGNPATMYGAPEGYNQLKAIGGMFGFDGKDFSVHSCYGLGKSGCGDMYGSAKSTIIEAQGR
ncbi:fhaB1 [Bartonella apihabitans]